MDNGKKTANPATPATSAWGGEKKLTFDDPAGAWKPSESAPLKSILECSSSSGGGSPMKILYDLLELSGTALSFSSAESEFSSRLGRLEIDLHEYVVKDAKPII